MYKKVVKEKVLEALRQEGLDQLHGCVAVLQAHFNSLLADPDELSAFFCEILQPLAGKGLQLYEAASRMLPQEWLACERLMYACPHAACRRWRCCSISWSRRWRR